MKNDNKMIETDTTIDNTRVRSDMAYEGEYMDKLNNLAEEGERRLIEGLQQEWNGYFKPSKK